MRKALNWHYSSSLYPYKREQGDGSTNKDEISLEYIPA